MTLALTDEEHKKADAKAKFGDVKENEERKEVSICTLIVLELMQLLIGEEYQLKGWCTDWTFSPMIKIHFALVAMSSVGMGMVIFEWNELIFVLLFLFVPDMVLWITWDCPCGLSIFGTDELENFCEKCKTAKLSLHECKEFYKYVVLERSATTDALEKARDNLRSLSMFRLSWPIGLSASLNIVAFKLIWSCAAIHEISFVTTGTKPSPIETVFWFGVAFIPRSVALGQVTRILLESNAKYIVKEWKKKGENTLRIEHQESIKVGVRIFMAVYAFLAFVFLYYHSVALECSFSLWY